MAIRIVKEKQSKSGDRSFVVQISPDPEFARIYEGTVALEKSIEKQSKDETRKNVSSGAK